MKMKIFFFCLLITPLLSAQDYYPLAVGNEWVYVFMKGKGSEKTKKITVKEYDKETGAYLLSTIFKLGAATPIMSQEVVEKRGKYILHLGDRGGLFGTGDWDYETYPLLELPFKIGKKWEHGDENHKHNYEVINKIDLRINGQIYKDVYVVRHINQDRVATLEYYAPNIGMIKETSEDGEVTILELISSEIK